MERWTGAFQDIRVRKFDDILAQCNTPVSFSFSGDENLLKDFIIDVWSEDCFPNFIINFPEKNQEFVKAFLTGYSKFEHVLDCSRNMFERGSLTWGLVDAYHASIVGARSIAAALGVCIFNIKGRTVLVDLFPELGSVDQRRAFRKANKDIEFPIRVLAPSKEKLLEQSKLWDLIHRLFNLRSFASSTEESYQTALSELIKAKPWADRHDILYDLASWRWPTDIALSPLQPEQLQTLMFATDDEVTEFNQFVDKIFELNRHYADAFLAKVAGKSIALPDGYATATAPGCLI
jgi:hypothetical protein